MQRHEKWRYQAIAKITPAVRCLWVEIEDYFSSSLHHARQNRVVLTQQSHS